MKIGIIGGTGKFGQALATRFAFAGHKVYIGSRNPQKAEEIVSKIKETSHIELDLFSTSNKGATNLSDIVFLSIPYEFLWDTLDDIESELYNKTIISNVVPILKEGIFYKRKDLYNSVSDIIDSIVPIHNNVISTLHTIPAKQLINGKKLDTFMFMNINNDYEKMYNLFKSINITAYNGGCLKESIIAEKMTVFLLNLNLLNKIGSKSLRLV